MSTGFFTLRHRVMSTSRVSGLPGSSELKEDVEKLNPTFCAICRRLSTLPEDPYPKNYMPAVEYTLGDIIEAAKRKCLLCCHFLTFLESGDGIENIA